jgi:hypothetical protein
MPNSEAAHNQTMKEDEYDRAIYSLIMDLSVVALRGDRESAVFEYQARLDGIMSQFEGDETLGRFRYALYEAQAYIYRVQGDDARADQYIEVAKRVLKGPTEHERMFAIQEQAARQ